MRITPLDIRQKEFKTSFKGYNLKEVQEFLLDMASEYENVINELNLLKEKEAEHLAEIKKFRSEDDKIKAALLAAQQLTEERKASAEKEASHIVKDAKLQAEEIHRQTRMALEKLENEIEDLKRFKRNFHAKLRSIVETHVKMLDESSLDEDDEEAEKKRIQAVKERR